MSPPVGRLGDLDVFDRDSFLVERWAYEAGQHVTIIGPTGSGKTWLGYQLLGRSARRKLPAVVLVMKPRDSTVQKFSRINGFKTVTAWPPSPQMWAPQPPGYVLWPRHTFDPERDDAMLHRQFRRAILSSYRKGNRILFCDEAYGLAEELGLRRELVTVWSRGRSMGTGVWAATQRPTHVPLHAYSAAEHLFLFKDPDKRARDRYSEIGGVDPDLVKWANIRLGRHQALYIRRDGPYLCVVDS